MCALQLFSRRLLDLTDFCPQKEGSTQKRKRSHKRIEYYPTLLLMREWSWMLGQWAALQQLHVKTTNLIFVYFCMFYKVREFVMTTILQRKNKPLKIESLKNSCPKHHKNLNKTSHPFLFHHSESYQIYHSTSRESSQ